MSLTKLQEDDIQRKIDDLQIKLNYQLRNLHDQKVIDTTKKEISELQALIK